MHGTDWHIITGLVAGERIVTDGAGKAKAGEKVRVVSAMDGMATTLSDSSSVTRN